MRGIGDALAAARTHARRLPDTTGRLLVDVLTRGGYTDAVLSEDVRRGRWKRIEEALRFRQPLGLTPEVVRFALQRMHDAERYRAVWRVGLGLGKKEILGLKEEGLDARVLKVIETAAACERAGRKTLVDGGEREHAPTPDGIIATWGAGRNVDWADLGTGTLERVCERLVDGKGGWRAAMLQEMLEALGQRAESAPWAGRARDWLRERDKERMRGEIEKLQPDSVVDWSGLPSEMLEVAFGVLKNRRGMERLVEDIFGVACQRQLPFRNSVEAWLREKFSAELDPAAVWMRIGDDPVAVAEQLLVHALRPGFDDLALTAIGYFGNMPYDPDPIPYLEQITRNMMIPENRRALAQEIINTNRMRWLSARSER